jgi:hypothetical protein
MNSRLGLLALASFAFPAMALDAPSWPPPAEVGSRMRELQLVIIDRDSTAPQREAAREELSSLLKSPAGQARGRTPDERPPRPARASIDPFPSVITPAPRIEAPSVPQAGVARVEVIEPPRRLANPQTGSAPVPTNRFAIDPRTGSVLHEIPGGYIDPRTGMVSPR